MIIELIYGFLGAGKTTFIRHLLEHSDAGERRVILVNEFGEAGIDGRILEDSGTKTAAVVEMPSGCICCTLAPDFRRQIIELSAAYAPDQLIIEPTGLATIGQIMAVLSKEDVQPLYTGIRLIHIVDGAELLALIKANRRFVENQIRASQVVILNKTDLLTPSRVTLLAASIRELNPTARVYPTSFARLDSDTLTKLFDVRCTSAEWLPETDTTLANGYESFGQRYHAEVFHPERLRAFFERLQAQRYGKVVRAKGIFRTDEAWLLIELAAGAVQRAPGPAGVESLVSVIGQRLNTTDLNAHLQHCVLRKADESA